MNEYNLLDEPDSPTKRALFTKTVHALTIGLTSEPETHTRPLSKRRKVDFEANLSGSIKVQKQAMEHLFDHDSFPLSRIIQPIEALPIEIIHQIFTLCLNPSLPAASFPLCRKHTNLQQLQKSLFLHAFYPSLVSPSSCLSLPRSLNGQLHYSNCAQTELFRLRWFTYSFVSATLAELNIAVPYWLRTHTHVTMPSKLLHGPWDEDKLSLLKLLFRSHAEVDDYSMKNRTTDMDIASTSFLEACRTNNVPVLKALVRKEYWNHTTDVPDKKEAENEHIWGDVACMKIFIAGDNDADRTRIDPDTGNGFSTSGSWDQGVCPETKHLRAAIVEGDAQRETLEVLWAAREHEMNARDRVFRHWIHEMRLNDSMRGEWLAEQLAKWDEKHPPYVQCHCEECYTSDCRRVPGLRNSEQRHGDD